MENLMTDSQPASSPFGGGRCLLIGASDFVGSALVRAWLAYIT